MWQLIQHFHVFQVGHVFVKMALNYFDEKTVYDRLAWWVEREGEIIDSLEIRAALH